MRTLLSVLVALCLLAASPADAQIIGGGIIGGRPHNWKFPEDSTVEQFYRNFPVTANWGTVFDVTASNIYTALTAPGATQKMYLDLGTGSSAIRAIGSPTHKFVFFAQLLPNASFPPPDSEYMEMRFLNASNEAVVSARLTYHGLADATGYADIKLYTDADSTGFTASNIVVRASSVMIGVYVEVHIDPSDKTANLVLSHRTLTDYSDGVLAKDGYYWDDSIEYTGTIARAQFLVPNQSVANVDCPSFSISQRPWHIVGDSNGEQLRKCFAVANDSSNGVHTNIPVVSRSMPNGQGQTVTTTVLAGLTTDQNTDRVIFGPLGTNDYGTTGSANQAALEAVIEADLAALDTAGVDVVVCTIPPRGSTSYPATARNEATTAAVVHTNALLRQLAYQYGFALIDLHDILYDGNSGSDLFDNSLTSDGVHILDFVGFEHVATEITTRNLFPFP